MKPHLFALAMVLGTAVGAQAQTSAPAADDMPEGDPVQVEFIQQAGAMTFDGTKLTLTNPSFATIVSVKGEHASSGVVTTEDFVKGFAAMAPAETKDAPNAMVVIAGSDAEPAVVELSAPTMQDGALVYTAEVLEGDLPQSGENVTVFIDPWIHVPAYRRWGAPVVIAPTVVVRPGWGPRCHYSPYYYGRVCRW